MNDFLRSGLAESDLARIDAMLAQTANLEQAALIGTWSPTRRVTLVVVALRGQVIHWQAMPADSEAEGREMATKVFGVAAEFLAGEVASSAIDRARLS